MAVRLLWVMSALVISAGCVASDPLVNEDYSGVETLDTESQDTSSTDYIVEQVSRQYSAETDRTLFVECPDQVRLQPGTTIECEAFDAEDDDNTFATITVTIINADGDFEFEAVRE